MSLLILLKMEKIFFLDATLKGIYRLREGDKAILYDEMGRNILVKTFATFLCNDFASYSKLKQRLESLNNSISKDEENRLIRDTVLTCNDNKNIFEHFYDENEELYTDISSKVLTIKKGAYL